MCKIGVRPDNDGIGEQAIEVNDNSGYTVVILPRNPSGSDTIQKMMEEPRKGNYMYQLHTWQGK